MTTRALLLLCLLAGAVSAQNLQDLWRYNQLNPTGSARSIAMGGAYTALGADFASATLNPAGLGQYKGSDISLTPYLNFAGADADYLGTTTNNSRALPGIGNFGMVFTNNNESGSLTRWSIAIGYNQLGNYLRRSSATGMNASSITWFMAEQANGQPESDILRDADHVYDATDYAGLGYNTGFPLTVDNAYDYDMYMFGPSGSYDANAGVYDYAGAFFDGGIEQTVDYKERGRHNEWSIAWGGTFNEKVQFGAKLGINDLNFRQTRTITETDVDHIYEFNSADPGNAYSYPLNQVSWTQDLRTSGVGVNASVGLIIKPIDYLRIGIAAHSPSLLSMRDRFSTTTYLQDDFGNEDSKQSAENSFNYRMVLPYRVNAGLMVQMGKVGVFGADVEIVDYRMTQLTATDGLDPNQGGTSAYFAELNRQADQNFQMGLNVRGGLEFRVTESFYLRGGYAFYSSTLNDKGRTYTDYNGLEQKVNGGRHFFTGGFGFRGEEGLYFNMAGMVRLQDEGFSVYQEGGYLNNMKVTENLVSVMATIGVYFR